MKVAIYLNFITLLFLSTSCNTNSVSQVPAIKGKLYNGDSTNLKDLSKNKITLINSWFIGCNPCMLEMPSLNKVYNKYKNNNKVCFLTIAANSYEDIDQFFTGDSLNIYHNLYLSYGLDGINLPVLCAVSKSNVIKEKTHNNKTSISLSPSVKEMAQLSKLLKSNAYPTTILYNKNGIEVDRSFSFNKENPQEFISKIEHKIDSLLNN